jgi:signal recognition particle receptor subunit beta
MALFNYATKEITLKIVYYGPGLSGKTTNLQHLHSILNPENKGRLLSLSTESDRTLFFDFLPVELGKIRDFSIRFQLYTVPGQVRYNATRKVVLKGADAVVFVADSQRDMREQNIESFENMRENLLSNNINPDEVPIVLQYNKRDLGSIASVEELDADLNRNQHHVVESSAISGAGVEDSFRLVTRLLLKHISKKHQIEIQPSKEKETANAQSYAGKKERSASGPPPAFKVPEEKPVAQQPLEALSIPPDTKESSANEFSPGPPVAASSPVAPASSPAEVVQALWPEEETERDIKPAIEPPLSIEPVHEKWKEEEKSLPPAEQAIVPPAEAGVEEVEPEEKIVSPGEKDAAEPAFEAPAEVPVEPRHLEVPAISSERIDRIIEDISSINGLLTDLKNSVYVLTKEMKDLKDIKKEQEETNRILREISEVFPRLQTKKEQEETNRILRDVLTLFQRLQTKKSWFRF